MTQIKGGKIVNLTDVKTTDSGDAPIEDYTEAPATPDEDGIPNAG